MDNQTTTNGLTIPGVKELLQTLFDEGENLSLNVQQSTSNINSHKQKYLDVIKAIKLPKSPDPELLRLLKLLERNMKSITSTHTDLVQSIKNSNKKVTQLIENAQLFIPKQLPKSFNKTRRRGDPPESSEREPSSNNIFTRRPGTSFGGYKKVYSKKRTNKH